jgi:ubiquinol oxidase
VLFVLLDVVYGRKRSLAKFKILELIAFLYYQQSWLLYVVRPKWSYRLNADFENHAEHEYMVFVAEHPEWETEPFGSGFADEYGTFESLADVSRQIGHEERVHKEESLAQMNETGSDNRTPSGDRLIFSTAHPLYSHCGEQARTVESFCA